MKQSTAWRLIETMKAPKLWLLIFGLFGLIALRHGTPPGRTHAQSTVARSHDWIQTTAADLATGETDGVSVTDLAGGELRLTTGGTSGIYTSTAVMAAFPFNAIVPHWQATVPQGGILRVEVRIYTESEGWSPWYPFEGADWVATTGRFYPEAPLLSWDGQRFQYRLILNADADGQSPILHEMAVTVIDTAVGPTTSQAKATTRPSAITVQAVPQPTIISREGWGADENLMTWPPEYRTVEKIVVHHTVSANDYGPDDGAALVRAIYYYHAVTRDWGDIGYNYLVDKYGNTYEGRYGGPGVVGGHVRSYNYGSMGIGTIGAHGNTTPPEEPPSVPPTAEALAAITDLAAWEATRSYIHPLESAPFYDAITPNLAGHRDYPPHTTACPGDYLYAELPGLRQEAWDRIVNGIDKYHADWLVWSTLPPALLAGETYSLTVTVRNTGWLIWPQAGVVNSVRLGYHWLDEDGGPVVQPPEDDHRGPLDHDITFGHTYEFNPALVTTPITPGVYTLAWDMVHEGVAWFHEVNADSPLLTMTLVVTDTPPLSISGKVLDLRGHPVSGGQVTLPGWLAVATGSDGSYALPRLPRAAYTLTASADGYAPQLPAYHVGEAGGDVTYPFVLAPEAAINLITNGGFEDGLTGWIRGPAPFAIYLPLALRGYLSSQDPTPSQPILSAAAHTGFGGAQLGGGASPFSPQLSQRVDLPPNVLSPTLSLLYRTPVTGDSAGLQVMLTSETSTLSHDLPLTDTNWTHFWASLPDTWSGSVDLQLFLSQSNPLSTLSVFVDEVWLGYRGCTELIVNGSFEEIAAWEILDTDYPAAYSTVQAHRGSQSLRAGIEPGGYVTASFSSAQQTVALPSELSSAALTYWRYPVSPVSNDADDLQYVLILDSEGNILDWLLQAHADDQTWLISQADLTAYAGQTVTLRFGAYNDGDDDLTRMYVDDVSLLACAPP